MHNIAAELTKWHRYLMRFVAEPYPCPELFSALERLAPYSPFNTRAYAEARMAEGDAAFVIGLENNGELLNGCLALLSGRRGMRTLELPSYPQLQDPELFTKGMRSFCRSHAVWDVCLSSYGSVSISLMPVGQQTGWRRRWEFVIDLTDLESSFRPSSRQRRNIRKALRAGITLRRSKCETAAAKHAQLMGASMNRRAARGELVDSNIDDSRIVSILRAGAGEIHQAVYRGDIVASILVVRSAKVAYYQSAGTAPEGMQLGASPFLISGTAEALAADGLEEFNLGGAEPDNPGLWDFKRGFGPIERTLEAGTYSTVPSLLRKLRTALRLVARDPRAFSARLFARDQFFAYTVAPDSIEAPELNEDYTFSKLGDETLTTLEEDKDFGFTARKQRQLGFNAAYGVYVGDELAHVSWMIDYERDRGMAQRNVRLRPGEAEITHCATAQRFRGLGLYPFAIRHLCRVAASDQINRVFMITSSSNKASQRGIEKAGLRRCGKITRYYLPWVASPGITIRRHRGSSRALDRPFTAP